MAISLSVTQSGDGDLLVYAGNLDGKHVAIIDHIILSVSASGWSFHTWYYEEDFFLGTPRVDVGWKGLMVKAPYSGGAGTAHAMADYWEVDERVKSPMINIS